MGGKKIKLNSCRELEGEEKLECHWENLRKVTEVQDKEQLKVGGALAEARMDEDLTQDEYREMADMQTVFDHLNWIQKVIVQTRGDPEKTLKYGGKDKFKQLEKDWKRL